ncbi:MAG: STAS-like domain-containing protein [Deltaproteobacteria bacterium]|nr:STAS-like domain-containing protein [Deltaproteobacteria bacterium]
MKKISIKQAFHDDYVSRVAGERLRHLIVESVQNKESVCLDFEGVVIASTSFFDEGIAKLALEGWDQELLKKWVRFERVNTRDRKVMERVCEFRGLKIDS